MIKVELLISPSEHSRSSVDLLLLPGLLDLCSSHSDLQGENVRWDSLRIWVTPPVLSSVPDWRAELEPLTLVKEVHMTLLLVSIRQETAPFPNPPCAGRSFGHEKGCSRDPPEPVLELSCSFSAQARFHTSLGLSFPIWETKRSDQVNPTSPLVRTF